MARQIFSSVIFIGLFSIALPARSEIAAFQQGVSDAAGANTAYLTEDTQITIRKIAGEYTTESTRQNYGAHTFAQAGNETGGRARILYRFDLSTMPANVDQITSARLVLTLRRITIEAVAFDPAAGDLRLYPVSPANADWLEGDATGGPIEAACWIGRRGATLPWTGQPGLATADTDYLTSPVAVNPAAAGFSPGSPWTFQLDPDLVLAWIRDPAANAGLLLRAEAAEPTPDMAIVLFQFHTDDAANTAFRPRLEVEYTLPRAAAGTDWLSVR